MYAFLLALLLADKTGSILAPRITALAITAPLHTKITDPALKSFLATRARNWIMSQYPYNTYLGPMDGGYLGSNVCHTFSAGPDIPSDESIFPMVYKEVLDWFLNQVANGFLEYDGDVPEDVRKDYEAAAQDTPTEGVELEW